VRAEAVSWSWREAAEGLQWTRRLAYEIGAASDGTLGSRISEGWGWGGGKKANMSK
jgi:hypothetical protein